MRRRDVEGSKVDWIHRGEETITRLTIIHGLFGVLLAWAYGSTPSIAQCELHENAKITASDAASVDYFGGGGGNGKIDVDDILCVLSGFVGFCFCPAGDIEPCSNDGDINVDDITSVLNAFIGFDACGCTP